jgi:hypothetical protein
VPLPAYPVGVPLAAFLLVACDSAPLFHKSVDIHECGEEEDAGNTRGQSVEHFDKE